MTTTRRTRSRHLRRIAPALLAVALVAAACGDDDGEVTFEARPDDPAAEDDGDLPEPPEDEPAPGPEGPAAGPYIEVESDDPFCTTYRDLENNVTVEFATPPETPEDFERYFGVLEASLATLTPVAPDEIADDLAAVRAGFDNQRSLLDEYDYDFTAIPPERQAEAEIPVDASEALGDWFDAECGVTFVDELPDGSAAPEDTDAADPPEAE